MSRLPMIPAALGAAFLLIAADGPAPQAAKPVPDAAPSPAVASVPPRPAPKPRRHHAASPAVRRVAAANRAATLEPASEAYINAVQVYPFADGAIYQVYAAPEPYYLASCDHCGWVGSTEHCSSDEDNDVFCPRCHHSGVDCGKVAERIGAQPPAGDREAVALRTAAKFLLRCYDNGPAVLHEKGGWESLRAALWTPPAQLPATEPGGVVQADREALIEALEALRLTQESEDQHSNCDDCEGQDEAEMCGTCFPLADMARLRRWRALALAGLMPIKFRDGIQPLEHHRRANLEDTLAALSSQSPAPASDNWTRCPSTHCERAQECRNPSECSGTGRAKRERDLFREIGGRPDPSETPAPASGDVP
jgi:hypothetical protein